MAQGISVRFAGVGSYLPERVVDNAAIAPRMNSTADWIFTHTGVRSRHVAALDESASVLGAKAGGRALESAGARPEEIGLVVCATTTPDYSNYPSTACLIQKRLGCMHAAAFDLAAACSGCVYALEMAKDYLVCHPERKALVVASEVLTRSLDFSDRSTAMLFGDGAGAAVLEAVPEIALHKSASVLGADGGGGSLIMRDGGFRRPFAPDQMAETVRKMEVPYLKMDGHAVFTFAVRKMDEVIRNLCEQVEMRIEDLDLIFPHQANERILDAVARRMKLPMSKLFTNIAHVGNTSAASIPICLDEAVRTGVLKDGMRIALAGFGSGLTWAGALLEWPYL